MKGFTRWIRIPGQMRYGAWIQTRTLNTEKLARRQELQSNEI